LRAERHYRLLVTFWEEAPMTNQREEVIRTSLAVKSTIEELQKQDYASVNALLREIDRRLDRLAASRAA
jgi:ribosomal protein RSM22 (predicted rRNA methylase)